MNNGVRVDFLAPEDARWTNLLGKVTHDFYHRPRYVEMCAGMENGEAGAFHVVEGGNEFLLPIILRELPDYGSDWARGWRDATSPYGYPGPIVLTERKSLDAATSFADKALGALCEATREWRILTTFVRFHPLLAAPREPFEAHGRLVMHGHTVSIDLTHSAEEIWAGIRRNHRTEIMMLERREDVRAEEDRHWGHLPEFLAAYHATMERVHAGRSYYFDEAYFAALRAALDNRVHLMLVWYGEQVAAGAVATTCCGIVQYHLAATAPEFFKKRPQKLLCRETWLWSQRSGARVFHLGGGVGGREDGVFRFKSGFSDLRHPFYTWRACSERAVYERLVAQRLGKDAVPAVDTDFFPAYRQPASEQNGANG